MGAPIVVGEIGRIMGEDFKDFINPTASLIENHELKMKYVIYSIGRIGRRILEVNLDLKDKLLKLLEVQRSIASYPNVYGVYDVTGESDSVILARFRDREELSSFIKTLLANEHVERTITYIVLDTIKEEWRPTQLIEKSIIGEKHEERII